MGTRGHESDRGNTQIGAEGAPVPARKRHPQHVVDARHGIQELQDLSTKHMTTEGPAEAVGSACQRIQKSGQGRQRLGENARRVAVRGRDELCVHGDIHIVGSGHQKTRAQSATAVQITCRLVQERADAARALLTYGFGVEVLARIGIPELRERMERLVKDRLDGPGDGDAAA